MKKILASVLTAAMMLSMGTAVWAELPSDPDVSNDIIDGVTLKTEKENDNGVKLEECISVHLVNTPTSAYSVKLLDAESNVLTTVTPISEDLTSMYYGAEKIDCKIILGNGESDNWNQSTYYPKDDVVPAAIALYTGSELTDVYTITADDITPAEWVALDSTTSYTEGTSQDANFNKTYVINNGESPAETFTFKFEYLSYENNDGNADTDVVGPELDNVTTTFSALTENTNNVVNVSLAKYKFPAIGVYTYKVTEVTPDTKTTGVTYSDTPIYLVVTVLRNEDNDSLNDTENAYYVAAVHYETEDGMKTGAIVNQYDSGSLKVTKMINGNMADMDEKFKFTITFAADGTEIKSKITADATSGTWSEDGLTYTIELGHKEYVTFSNIPATATYTVTEDAENYTSDGGVWSDSTKTISANDEDTVTFTNTRTSEVDTGISVDSIPYIAMLGVVAIGGTGLVISKKRRSED